jgi:hypothetical protein
MGCAIVTRPVQEILSDIDAFRPEEGVWLKLDDLLGELWDAGVTPAVVPSLFGVFERFPDEDGAGVLWNIIHGLESLDLDYERPLRDSMARQPSFMGQVMLGRLERSRGD